jgi:hypothetical protein
LAKLSLTAHLKEIFAYFRTYSRQSRIPQLPKSTKVNPKTEYITMATFTPPSDFLTGPEPEVEVTRVDFSKTECSEFKAAYAVILDNVLSPAECAQLISLAEQSSGGEAGNGKWERAMVNIGNNKQALYTDVRNCDRLIWDDHDIVDRIWQRCRPHVSEIESLTDNAEVMGNGPVMRGETHVMTRLNERMRFLKYSGGEYFNGKINDSLHSFDLGVVAMPS